MKKFLSRIGSGKLGIISKIAMVLGIAFVVLAVWGFIKSSHVSMTNKNGSAVTLFWVNMRWVNMALGIVGLGGGFWLLKKSESADMMDAQKTESEAEEEEDPFDFLK